MRRLVLVATLLSACGSGDRVVVLPMFSGSTVALLVLEGTEVVRASMHDLDGDAAVFEHGGDLEDASLALIAYESSADSLDLPLGALPLAIGPETATRRLPSNPADAFRFELEGPDSNWTPFDRSELAELMMRFEFEDKAPLRGCPVLETEVHNLDVAAHITFSLDVGGSTLLLGTERSKEGDPSVVVDTLLQFDLDNPGQEPIRVTRPAEVPILAAHYDGEWLWFFGEGGEVWRARKDDAQLVNVERLGTTSTGRRVRWADGGLAPNKEIYVLSESAEGAPATLERFDGAQWSVIYESPANYRFETRQDGFVKWVGPGHVLAGGRTFPGVIHVQNSIARVEHPGGGGEGYSVAEHLDGLGLVVGASAGGEFFRWSEGAWGSIGGSELALPAFAIGEFGPGFLAAGMTGVTNYFRFNRGFCEQAGITRAAHTTRFLVPHEGAMVGFGDVPIGGTRLPITVFREADRPPE